MNINVPPDARQHFWAEPPDNTKEQFWAFSRFKPPCEPGDELIFRFDGKPVASAICSRIEKPGQSNCVETGRFHNSWKVHWLISTFKTSVP
jgi:hypothetical protein